MYIHVGAEFSFRQRDFNRLFCEPTIHVRIFLIANTIAKAVKSVPAVFAQAFAPARLAVNLA
jgi:hypothetical protein